MISTTSLFCRWLEFVFNFTIPFSPETVIRSLRTGVKIAASSLIMSVVILILALVGVALGATVNAPTSTVNAKADPVPCDTALEWEGRSSEWDHVTEFNNRFLITFDGKNKRKRLMEEKKSYMPGHSYVEYLQFFTEKVEYQINHTFNTCKTLPLGPWRNHTIPRDAILEDQYDIGPPGNPIFAQEWSDRVTGRKKEEWIGVFTSKEDGCWPIFEIYSQDEGNRSISFSTRFFNLSLGIKDPSVFDIPQMCKEANFAGAHPSKMPTLPSEVRPTTEAPGFFAKMKAWLFSKKNESSDKLMNRVGLVNTWDKRQHN